VTLRDVLSFDDRPTHRKRPWIEPSSADEQLAVRPKLRFNSPAVVRAELTPKAGVIRLTDEFKTALHPPEAVAAVEVSGLVRRTVRQTSLKSRTLSGHFCLVFRILTAVQTLPSASRPLGAVNT
jgi:hypothetical protein